MAAWGVLDTRRFASNNFGLLFDGVLCSSVDLRLSESGGTPSGRLTVLEFLKDFHNSSHIFCIAITTKE